ncbi:MAG: PQQ-binding-like beta-propeller repeat protein [Verrucomicrobiota bacterium]|nr:PQQ-binding-like beta-propeller repeat protein [Verrucomicrobiota bacterium]
MNLGCRFLRQHSLTVFLTICLLIPRAQADWPAFRHDAERTGYTPEALPAKLSLQWVHHAAKPQPAWPRSRRMMFDFAHQPIAAGDMIWFGSSVDGAVHALEAGTGRRKWIFYTQSPIRFAPVFWEGNLFVGSDDGYLYCLKAANGQLLWKLRAGPSDEMVLGNGRMVSRWAVRGGAAIHDGILYFAAGIWRCEGVYVYAVNPKSGKVIWKNDSSGGIYMGQPHGGANAASGVSSQGYLAVTEKRVFVATGRAVPAAFDRATGKFQYYHLQANTSYGGSLIVVSDNFCLNRGMSFNRESGARVESIGSGTFAAIPGGVVRASDTALAAFKWGDKEVLDRKGNKQSKRALIPGAKATLAGLGANIIVADQHAIVAGKDEIAMINLKTSQQTWSTDIEGTAHGLATAGGRLFVSTDTGALYCFASGPAKKNSIKAKVDPSPFGKNAQFAAVAKDAIKLSGATKGFALDLGCGEGRLTLELAKASSLHVIGVESDPAKVASARSKLSAAGLYGTRVTIIQANPDMAPLPPYFANLVVSARTVNGGATPAGAKQMLRPYGGVMIAGQPGKLTHSKRGSLEGAGEWTHQYSNPANTTCSDDQLVKGPLGMLWFNDLGQEMTSRHGRAPSPLYSRGIIFSEGLDSLVAVDAYNGTKLWEYSLPGILRPYHGDDLMGTSGTGSNYCVSEDSVYVRRDDHCLRIDIKTGKLIKKFTAPKTANGKPGTWGYIAFVDGQLFGSLANPKHVVTYRYRPGGDMKKQLTESTSLFAINPDNGKTDWRYDAKDALRHNTIAIGGGNVLLIDRPLAMYDQKRDGKPKGERPGRLVALYAKTGEKMWEEQKDIYGTVNAISAEHGVVVMGYSPTRFKLASEIGGRLSGFRLSDGKRLWDVEAGYSSRPMINGKTIYAQGGAWDVTTGKPRDFKFKRSYGCGTLASSANLLVFRSATLGYADLKESETTRNFGGMRPGCWINAIPAGGLVLVPDASASCKCSYQNRSWVALRPREAK